MDLSSLNDNEVKALIEELKNFLKEVRIEILPIGKYKQVAEVVGKASGISYRLHIYRGLLENKYSMHLRFAENNIHLVRLCINGNKHHNICTNNIYLRFNFSESLDNKVSKRLCYASYQSICIPYLRNDKC